MDIEKEIVSLKERNHELTTALENILYTLMMHRNDLNFTCKDDERIRRAEIAIKHVKE